MLDKTVVFTISNIYTESSSKNVFTIRVFYTLMGTIS